MWPSTPMEGAQEQGQPSEMIRDWAPNKMSAKLLQPRWLHFQFSLCFQNQQFPGCIHASFHLG